MAFSLLGSISLRRGYDVVSKLIHRSLSSSSSPVSSRMSPGLVLQPSTIAESGDAVFEFFSLAENRVLSFKSLDYETLLGCSQGWLGVQFGTHYGLINPLTHRLIKLPCTVTPPPSGTYQSLLASKIILSCSPDKEIKEEEEEEGECRALLTYGIRENRLAFCCPGRSHTWTAIGDAQYYGSTSVYSRRQKLFFCTRADQLGDYGTPERGLYLEAWDLRDPLSPKMFQMSPNLDFSLRSDDEADTKDFLAINDDTDDLFLVRRFIKGKPLDLLSVTGHIDRKTYDDHRYNVLKPTYHRYSLRRYYHDQKDDDDDDTRPYKTITFDVHRYDPESRSFRYMDPRGGSLDGLSFFIDENNGFALPTEEFPELKRDSIYFIVWSPPAWDDTNFGGYDLGVYSYQDSSISPCYYPSDSHRFRTMALEEPRWFIPNPTTTTTTTKPN